MINKEKIYEFLRELKAIAEEYELDDSIKTTLDCIFNQVSTYRAKITLVGRFSSGKSSLMNSAMSKKIILPEDQLPQTALATELYYSKDEYAEFFAADGSSEKYSFDEAADMLAEKADNFEYCKYYINSDYLKENPEIIFVDMPGFDSSVERHNKAIQQYIGKADAYILVVDCEDGNVSGPTIEFLNEIKKYRSNIAVAVTKCDKKTVSDVNKIKSNIENTMSYIFGEKITVVTTHAEFGVSAEAMNEAVSGIDIQKIFDEKFYAELTHPMNVITATINTIKDNLYLSTTDIDKQIVESERELQNIKNEFEKSKKDLSRSIEESVEDIADAVKRSLENNIDSLVKHAVSENALKEQINNIARPILIERISDSFELNISRVISNLNIIINDVTDGDEIARKVQDGYDKFRESIKQQQDNMTHAGFPDDIVLADNLPVTSDGTNDGSTRNAVQSMLGILSIATDFVHPAIELAIVCLPTVINFVQKAINKSKLRDQILYEVIPQIKRSLIVNIKQLFADKQNELLEDIEMQYSETIAAKKEALEKLKNSSEAKKKAYDEKIDVLNETLKKIDSLKKV